MNTFRLRIALVGLAFALPAQVFASGVTTAPRAGTDDYLRQVLGMTDEQLNDAVSTEDREPFGMAHGTVTVTDPIGDVLNRWGQSTDVYAGWGDVKSASLGRNDLNKTWDFTVVMGETIPPSTDDKAQLFILIDSDGTPDNNATIGMRIDTDTEFSLQYGQDKKWYTDFRWYNPDADFWALNKETAATFDVNGNTITYRIPFSEIPATENLGWRVIMGVSDNNKTQIDSAHDVGFPPAKGATTPTPTEPETEQPQADASSSNFPIATVALIGVGVLVIGYSIWTVRKG